MGDNKKDDIINEIMDIRYYPVIGDEDDINREYSRIPITEIAALGTAFSTFPESFRTIAQTINTGTGQQLYKAVFPAGVSGQLARFKDGSGLIGAIVNDKGVVGQARWIPVDSNPMEIATVLPYNPAMMFMAMAIAHIDHKLDKIIDKQEEIINIILDDKEAQLRTDLRNLADIQNQYKFNWDNEKFVQAKLGLVQDIKRNSSKEIESYRIQINRATENKKLIHWDSDTKNKLKKVQRKLRYYQLAVYSYAFASFLEVMLLGNFNASYLNTIEEDIKERADQYDSFYQKCYDKVKTYANQSLESVVVKSMANMDRFTGNVFAKTPLINKTPIDETLINAGDWLAGLGSEKIEKRISSLSSCKDSGIYVFADNINKINELYNKPLEIVFDEEYIYIDDRKTVA